MIHIIKNTFLELHTTPWGASMKALFLNDRSGQRVNVIYGYKEESAYQNNLPFLGATCGRYAGRIAGHSFSLDGTTYPLESFGDVHLHGGKRTLGWRKWTRIPGDQKSTEEVIYRIHSDHLDGGYPGNLEAEARYRLEGHTLKICYRAWSDRDTYLNLTNHNYYNLNGGGSISDHLLFLNAGSRLETNSALIPTGSILRVKNTPFDHTRETPLSSTLSETALDHTFALKKDTREAARLYAPESGIEMKLYTDQPGLVVFTPQELPEGYYDNERPESFPAICLEAQQFPNAPNEPKFPSALLKKGVTYTNNITLEFSRR